jgi:hypothetical protein
MGTFLRLDGVKGDSLAAEFFGWIELESASFGSGRNIGVGSSAAGSFPTASTQLHCTAESGSHSVALQRLLAEGRIVEGDLVITNGGHRYAQAHLKGVLVTSWQTGRAGGSTPWESFELNALPIKLEYSVEARLLGRWNVTIGQWHGLFVFEAGGRVHWTERNGTSRHDGLWKKTVSDVQWKFASPGDIRTFVIPYPIPSEPIGGRILPVGQGFFTMQRA